MSSKEKPYILLVAEAIYSKVCEIKKKNPELSNINAIENFIGSTTYNEISSGKFHDELIDKVSKKKYLKKHFNCFIFKKIYLLNS